MKLRLQQKSGDKLYCQLRAERERRRRWRERKWRQSISLLKQEKSEMPEKIPHQENDNTTKKRRRSEDLKISQSEDNNTQIEQRTTRSKEAFMKRRTRSTGSVINTTIHFLNIEKSNQRKSSSATAAKEQKKKTYRVNDVRTEETKKSGNEEHVSNTLDSTGLKVRLNRLQMTAVLESSTKPESLITTKKKTNVVSNRIIMHGLESSNVTRKKRRHQERTTPNKESVEKQVQKPSIAIAMGGSRLCTNPQNSSQRPIKPASSNSLISKNTTNSLPKHHVNVKTSLLRQKLRSESEVRLKKRGAGGDSKLNKPDASKNPQPMTNISSSSPKTDPNIIRSPPPASRLRRRKTRSKLAMQASLSLVPPNIKWKTSSLAHLVKECVKECGG